MKKVLSVVLAIVMIAACMPVAFAAECEHEYDAQSLVRPNYLNDGYYVCPLCDAKVVLKRADYSDFDDVYVTFCAYNMHVYASEEIDYEIYLAWEEEVAKAADYAVEQGLPDFYTSEEEFSIFNLHEGEQHILDGITAIFAEGIEKIDAILASYENPILFDGTDFEEAEYYFNLIAACYTEEEFNTTYQNILLRNPEELAEIFENYEALEGKLSEDRYSVTEEEYDEATAGMVYYFVAFANCIADLHNYGAYSDNGDGTHKVECSFCVAEKVDAHIWSEYVYNGDATTEADGTKTAECLVCDATDTVAAEGTKLPSGEETPEPDVGFFGRIIETIKAFFNNIIEFFKKMFA